MLRIAVTTILLAATAHADSPVPFGNAHYRVTGFNPYALASGDVNNDSHPDIVVCTHQGGQGSDPGFAEVFINNGDATYAAPVAYQVGRFPRNIRLADFNGDTFADIVTANDDNDDDFSVLLNNGDGSFASSVNYGAGLAGFGVEVADFDDDGDIDIATTSSPSHDVIVWLNNGAGVFTQGITPFNFTEGPTDLTVADLNGDTFPDLIVANYFGFHVLLNNGPGAGEWGGLSNTGLVPGGSAWDIEVGELDDQPGLDVIYTSWLTDEVYVHLADGSGGFLAPVTYATGNSPQAMQLADIDQDGDLDFAATVFGDQHRGSVIAFNDGAGGFASQMVGENTLAPRDQIFIDANADGWLDLVTCSSGGDSSICVAFNDGAGNIALGQNIDIATMGTDITSADFDNDGNDDIAYTSNLTDEIHVVMSNRERTFGPLQIYPTNGGVAPWRIASGDLNNDGAPDIAAGCGASMTGATVLLSNGDGTFAPAITYPAPVNYRNIDLGDVNGDGYLDIVGGGPGTTSGQAYVLLNNTDGTFGAAQIYNASAQGDGAVAVDLDNDGDVDIAIGDLNSKVTVILNNNDGTFTPPATYATGVFVQDLDSGDFDGDGDIDLATSNRLDFTVSVLLNNGDGTFAPRIDYDAGGPPFSLAIGDVDNDGALDIMCPLYSLNIITGFYQKNTLLLGNGDGTFAAPILMPGYAPQFLAMGDFDNDGALDTVTQGDLFGIDVLWGLAPAPTPCPGDINNSGAVDVDDLNQILSNWGLNVGVGSPIDLANNDGLINVDDLNVVLSNWGQICP